jgi:hypothetical protein
MVTFIDKPFYLFTIQAALVICGFVIRGPIFEERIYRE